MNQSRHAQNRVVTVTVEIVTSAVVGVVLGVEALDLRILVAAKIRAAL